jgi:hypothetical protein
MVDAIWDPADAGLHTLLGQAVTRLEQNAPYDELKQDPVVQGLLELRARRSQLFLAASLRAQRVLSQEPAGSAGDVEMQNVEGT